MNRHEGVLAGLEYVSPHDIGFAYRFALLCVSDNKKYPRDFSLGYLLM